jgi:hypothetical protein
MSDAAYQPVMIALQCDDRPLLEAFKDLGADIARTGDIQTKRRVEDAPLSPWDVAQYAYQVVGVIGAIGGAVRFIDWALDKVRAAKSTPPPAAAPVIQIQITSTRIELSSSTDPEAVRKELQKLLRIEVPQ